MENDNFQKKDVEFDKVAEDYDAYLRSLGIGDDTDKFAEYKVKLLHELVGDKLISILDFGCGTGRGLKFFDKYFDTSNKQIQLWGCDVSDDSLQVAKKDIPQAELFRDTTPDEFLKINASWSLIFLSCVFHHIPIKERQEWVRAIYEKTDKGGYIAVFEHNIINPFTKKIITSPQNELDHVENMLTHKQLIKLLMNSGVGSQLFWDGYTLFFPKRFRAATLIERMFKFVPLGAQHCVIIRKGD